MNEAELHVATLELLLAAVHADDPKRELLVRVGDALREAKAIAERVGLLEGALEGERRLRDDIADRLRLARS